MRTDPPRRSRIGTSLLEVLIATAILAVLMTALLQALNGMRQYASFADVQDDLLLESQKIVNELNGDMSQGGWFFPNDIAVTTANDRVSQYYPYVQVQNPTGSLVPETLGSQFPAHKRTLAQVQLTTPVGLPGNPSDFNQSVLTLPQFRTSFYARSQEIIFLHVNARIWGSRPSNAEPQTINFSGDYTSYPSNLAGNQDVLGIKRWANYTRGTMYDATSRRYYTPVASAPGGRIYDIVPGCMWLRVATARFPQAVPMLWETVDNPLGATGIATTAETATAPVALDVARLREYTYAVVPNPIGGRGQLVRAYRKPRTGTDAVVAGDRIISGDANYAIVVDEVVSDRVDRITFETAKSDWDNTLQLNQVRVRIFLSRQPDSVSALVQTRVVEATLATRATTDPEYISAIGSSGTNGYLLQH